MNDYVTGASEKRPLLSRLRVLHLLWGLSFVEWSVLPTILCAGPVLYCLFALIHNAWNRDGPLGPSPGSPVASASGGPPTERATSGAAVRVVGVAAWMVRNIAGIHTLIPGARSRFLAADRRGPCVAPVRPPPPYGPGSVRV
jgi:hypothetical protein